MKSIPSRNSRRTASMALAMIGCLGLWCAATTSFAAENSPGDNVDLPQKQQNLAERYKRLELLAGRLAELSRGTQPQRAKLLREVIARSREQNVPGKFAKVVQALEKEQFSGALTDQKSLHADLKQLLELMLQEDRDREIESERKRVARYLKNLNKLIRQQRGIKARNEGRDSTDELSEDQGQLSEQTGKLGKEIQEAEIGESPGQNSKESAQESEGQGSRQSEEGEPSESKAQSDGKSGEQGKKSKDPSKTESENSPSQSGESKPGDSKQSEGSKSDGQPDESQSGQGQPSEGQQGGPNQGQPNQSQGQPGQPQEGQSQKSQSQNSPQPEQPNQSPAERATQRLQQAQRRMQQAEENLKKSQREDALKKQEQALRELETAKAELEKILRQLREEEMQRMLVMLEARFRKMLDAEVEIYDETVRLDKSSAKAARHEFEIAAGRLSRKQDQVVREADRALTLLREDGTSVAFPEALEQARDDMRAASLRLSEFKTSIITQALEEDVIAALEETLAALQKALEELREQQFSQEQQQEGGGGPGEQPLVDQLAELRMIRALQNRVNKRTKRYDELIEGEQALEAELLDALQALAERQERIFEATHDLHTGRNR